MIITNENFYGGSMNKINRLGLTDIYIEVKDIISSTYIEILDKTNSNSAGEVRKRLDNEFLSREWIKENKNGLNWFKERGVNQEIIVRLGVMLQISSRSDSLTRDIVLLRNSFYADNIDACILVVPNDETGSYLTDRTPSAKDVLRCLEVDFKEAANLPIVVLEVNYDRIGRIMPKLY
ncbi:hypothetical protein [Paenibacillus sp. USHLN196]|uniref:hypothetical protein n=1 Tax=Paenibacillus sp. USHLN196 TaxID=3081291 RepID=UPI003015ABAF